MRHGAARSVAGSATCAIEALESRALLAAVFWNGGGGDQLWSNPLNWATKQLPGVNDDVVIDVPGTPTIQFTQAAGTAHVRSINSKESLTITGGTLAPSTSAQFGAGATLLLQGGRMEGAEWSFSGAAFRATGGTIAGSSVYAPLVLDQVNAEVTLEGEASVDGITLKASGAALRFGAGFSLRNVLTADGGGQEGLRVYLRSDLAIDLRSPVTTKGSATLEVQAPEVSNSGLIVVSGSSSAIEFTQGQVANRGALQLFGGAMRFGGQTFTNAMGGWINAMPGTELEIVPQQTWTNAGMIVGDTAVLTFGGEWPASNIDASVFVLHSCFIRLEGLIQNTSHMLRFDGAQASWLLLGEIRGGAMEVGPDRPIRLSQGTLRDVQVTTALDLSDGSNLTIAGQTRFTRIGLSGVSSKVFLEDGYVLRDTIVAGTIPGDMQGLSLSLVPLGALEIAASGKVVAGRAEIVVFGGEASTIVNHGLIEVASYTLLELRGQVVLAPEGVLRISAEDAHAGSYGQILNEGSITLGGRLEVISEGYVAKFGETLGLVLNAGGTTAGAFDAVSLPQPADPALRSTILYAAEGVRMFTTSVIDFNFDGTMDLQDYFAFFNRWDITDSSLDLNGDGSVDLGDYFLFFTLWDQG